VEGRFVGAVGGWRSLGATAVDAAGNYSKPSNSVTFTLPRDTVAPTQPLVSITDVGASHVSLLWSSVEDGPNVWFSVFVNGNPVVYQSRNTSTTFTMLDPETPIPSPSRRGISEGTTLR